MKILIIDDDTDLVIGLTNYLTRRGYKVASACKENEVYEHINGFAPDLIIMDVLLSGVDGREICKKIKNTEGWKAIPVIMFSAHPGAQKNIQNIGADDFIPKPFQLTELQNRIEVLLLKEKSNFL